MLTLLLDGHNLLYRAFTSLPSSIVDVDGEPIHGLYGLLGTVLRLAGEYAPSHVVAAFDEPDTPTFRHRLYPSYQGQRGPLGGEHAPNFSRQIGLARSFLPRLGVPALTFPGYEADDVMGTLAVSLVKAGHEALIVSTDRDLLQLVRPGVGVITPSSPPVVATSEQHVVERLGVRPSDVTTWKALAGDPSDNIPGVAGIGVKTATDLVHQFGSLEAIYENIEALPKRRASALTAGRDDAFLFRQLVTVVTDLNLSLDIEGLPALAISPDAKAGNLLRHAGIRQ
jgi:DNA polymerase-1